MQGSTHIAIGFMTGATVAAHYHVPLYLETGAVLTIAAVGSLLPDIDHPASKISHSVKLFGRPFQLFAHRGLTHSLVVVVGMALFVAFFYFGTVDAGALLRGYISHLLADALTKSGIRLWWPSQRRFRLLPKRIAVVTGSLVDWLFAVVALVIAVWILVQGH